MELEHCPAYHSSDRTSKRQIWNKLLFNIYGWTIVAFDRIMPKYRAAVSYTHQQATRTALPVRNETTTTSTILNTALPDLESIGTTRHRKKAAFNAVGSDAEESVAERG